MSLEYNTQRPHLTLKEYGRNVQNLVDFIRSTDDKEKRNKYASVLVELMKIINPDYKKEAAEYTQKVWDDLFIISNFNLDVESPYPIPESTILDKKPNRVRYQSNEIKHRHYGRNLEILIQKAIDVKDPEEKESAIIMIGKLMKTFYQTWNRDLIEDESVMKTLRILSNNQLDIDIEKVKAGGLFDSDRRERSYDNNRGQNNFRNRNNNNNNKGGKRPFQKNNNNNNRRRNNN